MTNDDIIRLMQDACDKQKVDPWHDGYCTVTQEELKRFAEMVAAAEREACAKLFDDHSDQPYYGRHAAHYIRSMNGDKND